MAQTTKQFVYILILAMIITGSLNTLVYKYQNSQIVTVDGIAYPFEHPFMQTVTMFIGEALCIFLFFYDKNRNKQAYEQKQMEAQAKGLQIKINYFLILIPAGSDFMTSTLQYISLNFLNPSIYQMIRGGVIVITALFSIYFLKRKLYVHHFIGCCCAIIGITIVGISNFAFGSTDSGKSSEEQAVAMFLIVISLITNGILFVSEEKLFSKYYLEPFQIVGCEGIWGLILYAVALPMFSLIPCAKAIQAACVEYNGHDTLESPALYLFQMQASAVLAIAIVLGIFTIAMFNFCGVSVTKHVSSLARSIVDVTRTVVVWLVGIIVTVTNKNNPNYQWENTGAWAIVVEAIGFIILVSGNLIYNEIIILPFAKPPEVQQNVINNDLAISLQEETTNKD